MKFRLLLAAAALLALPAVWYLLGKRHRFAYWIDRKSDAEVAALATAGWQVDRLEVAPGVELVGLVRPPRSPDARWILFVPGNSTDLLRGFRDVLDGLRGDDDVGLAFWAYRGFEASGGAPDQAALRTDLQLQWRRLRQLGATAARTEIWGYSLGSVLAPHLCAWLCDQGETPRRLVLLATGDDIPIMPFGLFGRLRASERYELDSAVDRVCCPVEIAHGTLDDALPIAGAEAVARRFGARATFHALDGCGHADLWPAARAALWRR
ncbi:MAG: hypothetical protein H6835_11520 [Planctomycetes bacterium]|nr:hypothetical protein [Planctomycetota bacterium]